MRGALHRPSHEVRVRDAGKGQGGQGSNGGHKGGGGGAGSAHRGGSDNTSTAGTSTQQETTTAAIAATTSASTTETSTRDITSETPSATVAWSSDSTAVSDVASTTATAQTISSTGPASSEVIGTSSTALTRESASAGSALLPSQTTSADYSETYSGAVSALSATSSATPTSSSKEHSNAKSLSSSQAGIIAGVIVGLFSCIAVGFILYRFRKARPIQRMMTTFQKSADMQNRPYQDMEKPCVGMAPNMTGETLVDVNTMRKIAPSSSLPTRSIRAGGTSAGSHLIVDTEYLGPAAANSVSPVSSVSDLGPEVSPVSSASTKSNIFPTQRPFIMSNTLGTHRTVSMAGSEARIVSIPPRSSRTLAGGAQPGSSRQVRPRNPSRGPLTERPTATFGAFKGEAGSGSDWKPPSQGSGGPAELRPPPLSISRYKQTPSWSENASRPAGTTNNAGYRPYHPSMSRQPQRISQGSVSGASIASSDVFSLTDAISWPKPPRTPTASPDRR